MKSPWSSLLALLAANAVFHSHVAVAANAAESGPPLISDIDASRAALAAFAAVTAQSEEAWMQVHQWIGESYGRAPALMLGLAVLLVVPPLALAGMLMRRQRRSPDSTIMISRPSGGKSGPPGGVTSRPTAHAEISSWPTQAWVEVADGSKYRHIIGRTLIRIGREADNDICLTAKTVHRYHAVIRRTTDGDVLITDLSGSEGNGVLVNGARTAEARLSKGDNITIGEVKLKFDARPV
jgi:hypothetical protein